MMLAISGVLKAFDETVPLLTQLIRERIDFLLDLVHKQDCRSEPLVLVIWGCRLCVLSFRIHDVLQLQGEGL